ncbi:hypothetical protein EVAR_14893_1 [Eumeta japonica]|uniref:Uncharacterized protein n=1 Tax=Eumeta variegata TaxID=151549 RepID=A0A4C1V4J8_EUMVA|nr:hypothetical protein EVAR_14893_1 [Eumeta japonica]
MANRTENGTWIKGQIEVESESETRMKTEDETLIRTKSDTDTKMESKTGITRPSAVSGEPARGGRAAPPPAAPVRRRLKAKLIFSCDQWSVRLTIIIPISGPPRPARAAINHSQPKAHEDNRLLQSGGRAAGAITRHRKINYPGNGSLSGAELVQHNTRLTRPLNKLSRFSLRRNGQSYTTVATGARDRRGAAAAGRGGPRVMNGSKSPT